MKTAGELIEELNTLDEHVSIEAKTASELGESVLETVCAFANEPHLGGGHLILGVAAASDSFWPLYEAVGVPDADRLQNNIASQCASSSNVPINNTTFRSLNRECDTLSASKHLRRLIDFELLEKKGSGSGTYYVPSTKAMANWPVKTSSLAKSTEQPGKSTELEGKSTELSTELRDRIAGSGRKADKTALLQLVVDILAERPLSAGDLALALGRTQKHVRTEYLQPLLDEGRVVRSNPDKPTDPNQTYRVPEDSENRQ